MAGALRPAFIAVKKVLPQGQAEGTGLFLETEILAAARTIGADHAGAGIKVQLRQSEAKRRLQFLIDGAPVEAHRAEFRAVIDGALDDGAEGFR